MGTFDKINNQRGVALFIALMLMLMLSVIGMGIIHSTNDEISIAGNELNEMKAFYAAEAGLDQAAAAIQTVYDLTGEPPDSTPIQTLTIDDISVTFQMSEEDTIRKVITKGSLAGMNSLTLPFTIASISYDSINNTTITLEETFEVIHVPLFQFAVYYNDVMQFAPTSPLTINGRVFGNDDIWVQSTNGLEFSGKVMGAGDIHHGLVSGQAASNGDVSFMDNNGDYQSMLVDADWIDSDLDDWFELALNQWDGNVQDRAFGTENLELPVMDSGGDPHKAIERYDGGNNPDSYEQEATLKIIDGDFLHYNGSAWVDVTAAAIADGIITFDNFTDGREGKTVRNNQIDMSLLRASAYFPSNGIVYISDQRNTPHNTINGTTLVNGSEIGGAMTIVSENPLYIEGNFNTVNKAAVSALADATTFLSTDWTSTNKANSDLNYDTRPVTGPTTVNLSLVTGDVAPTETNYGGGVSNLPRFLEDWGGEDFTLNGSVSRLWNSLEATGSWQVAGSPGYYSEPSMTLNFDTDLNDPDNLPPGTPMVRTFMRFGWKQSDVDHAELFSSDLLEDLGDGNGNGNN